MDIAPSGTNIYSSIHPMPQTKTACIRPLAHSALKVRTVQPQQLSDWKFDDLPTVSLDSAPVPTRKHLNTGASYAGGKHLACMEPHCDIFNKMLDFPSLFVPDNGHQEK